MARLPTPRREDLSSEHQAAYDAIVSSRGQVSGPFTMLLYSPVLAGRVADVGSYVRFESILPLDLRCLAALAVARELNCCFEWAGWTAHARNAGIPESLIVAIRHRKVPRELTDDQALVLDLAQQLLRKNHHLDHETYAAAVQRFGGQGAVELSATVGYFAMLAMTLNAFEVDVPPGADELPI